MTQALDLDAYLTRIGHAGPRTPTLDTLRAIHLRHAETIAFENLDPLIGVPVRLDAASLQQKLVHGQRGGYCYEQNLLLRHALEALGFSVTGLAARVLWNAPEGIVTARSHMLLRVAIEKETYIADVGFGGQTLTGPLRLVADIEQQTPHEPFRILREGETWVLQAKVADAWAPLYRFDLQEQFPIDYEVVNHYMSTHPRSFFLNALVVARPEPGGRRALFNNTYTVHHMNGPTERRTIASARELKELLQGVFGLDLPRSPQLDAVLRRFATSTS